MGKFIDYTGRAFGRCLLLERVENTEKCKNTPSGRVSYLCRCNGKDGASCGVEFVACLSDLKSGHTKSCGCLTKEMRMARSIDYTGYTFCKHCHRDFHNFW